MARGCVPAIGLVRDENRMKIAITGARGVLGRLSVEALTRHGLVANAFEGDVRSGDEVDAWLTAAKPTHLLHFAAKVPVSIVEKDPLGAYGNNVVGTQTVLQSVAKNIPGCWLFVASTSHVYASAPAPIAEDGEIRPQNTYAYTKYVAEQSARFFLDKGLARVCIGRIFSFWHESQPKPYLYPAIRERIATHDPSTDFELAGGDDVRDFSPAEEIVERILALQRAEFTGTINVASGVGTSVRDFVQRMGGGKLRIKVTQDRPATRLVADISLLKKVIGDRSRASFDHHSDV